jgi:hypothetical protein
MWKWSSFILGQNFHTVTTKAKYIRTCHVLLWRNVFIESKISPHFREPEISLPRSKCPSPVRILSQLDAFHKPSSYFLMFHFYIIFPTCLDLPSGNFPSGFPTENLHTPLLSPIRTTCHTHLTLFDFSFEQYCLRNTDHLSSSLCSFLHSLVSLFHLDPNILLNTLSNTLTLRSFLNDNDHVSHP